ncbi:MAG: hypothetical protein HFI33_07185 [Lachnospiraceae bacterium]|nr:hypothetical protein [Lachnospiraceae bacterium]
MKKTRSIILLLMAGVAVTVAVLKISGKKRKVFHFVMGVADGPTSIFIAGKLPGGKRKRARHVAGNV